MLSLVAARHLASAGIRTAGPVRCATCSWPSASGRSQTRYDTIQDDYYRPIERDQLVDDALAGAVASLGDRFSNYFDPKDYRRFQEDSHGQFSGVGMEVTEVPRGLRVMRVFPRDPAARAGIRPGDEIVAVNGRSIAEPSQRSTTALIRGRPGHLVTPDGRSCSGAGRRAWPGARSTPRRSRGLRTVGGRRIGVVALRASRRARTVRSESRSTVCSSAAPRRSCSTCAGTAAAC